MREYTVNAHIEINITKKTAQKVVFFVVGADGFEPPTLCL